MSNIGTALLESTITSLEVEKSDGSAVTCYMRDLSAGDVLDFVGHEEGPERNAALLNLVAKAIVNEDGSQAFSKKDDLSTMPVKIFEQLSNAVVAAAGLGVDEDEEGEEKGNS